MRRLVVWNMMTLDGCFEGTAPWALDFHMRVWGDELEAHSLAQGAEIGTLLFGRRTYEGMAEHWREAEGPVAEMMNGLEKAVATRTLDRADWVNTRLLKGDAVEHVAALKAEAGKKDVFIFGSAHLTAALLRAGAVDEVRLFLVPVALGKGTPLFKADGVRKDFDLAEARAFASGGVLLRYLVRTDG